MSNFQLVLKFHVIRAIKAANGMKTIIGLTSFAFALMFFADWFEEHHDGYLPIKMILDGIIAISLLWASCAFEEDERVSKHAKTSEQMRGGANIKTSSKGGKSSYRPSFYEEGFEDGDSSAKVVTTGIWTPRKNCEVY